MQPFLKTCQKQVFLKYKGRSMTSIERTAYPRLNSNRIVSQKNLYAAYTLTPQEEKHIKGGIRKNRYQLCYAIQLKVMQNLGYFVDIENIPQNISNHLRKSLGLHYKIQPTYESQKMLSRHRKLIRQYLGVTPWGLRGDESARRLAIKVAYQAAQTLNTPADIINAVIEELRTHHFELPAFSTLCRLVRHVRSNVNNALFQQIFLQLTKESRIPTFEELLKVPEGKLHSPYQDLKNSPKSPRINDFKELILHHRWLSTLGDMDPFLKDLSKPKCLQLAEEARSLDISNLMDLSESRRHTLIACLIDNTQKKIKDNMAEVFCKTVAVVHKRARAELTTLREKNADKAQELAYFARSILGTFKDIQDPQAFFQEVSETIESNGGVDELTQTCERVIACNSTHHHPLLWTYFRPRRSALFDVLESINLGSSTQNDHLMKAIQFLIANRHKRSEFIKPPSDLNLDFISDAWRELVYKENQKIVVLNRRFFEVCICTYLSYELTSGDIFIKGADAFSDYRASLLSQKECQDFLDKEPKTSTFSTNAEDFVRDLKDEFTRKTKEFDDLYPKLFDFIIDEKGVPSLKKTPTSKPTLATLSLVDQIQKNMPERHLLDILCSTHHTTGWAFEFGPLSGSEARFEQPIDRYILNTFCYGTGMGPNQTAKHVRTSITPHMLSWINQRHVSINILDKAKDRVVNYTKDFLITKAWGDGSRCAADGTLRDIYDDNLMAETHFRYVAKGGISYNHIADTYVALFSTFMRCGLWEAVAILDGLLKNDSIINPTTVHADTQGQSTVVFGLAYLLGIKLMPRIRNWKDLKFFRPDKNVTYQNVDALFSDTINWDLIKAHWLDLMQVVLSIKHGKISSSLLLRKLGTYSRKNRLYQAFQELGRVIRTLFLLEYLSDLNLRETISATTNKVEAYNALSEWVLFASRIIVASNEPDEMEKAIKYNLLICNCLILQNIIDLTETIHTLQKKGLQINKEDISRLSPYMRSNIKRFGDYVLDLETKPTDVERIKNMLLFS